MLHRHEQILPNADSGLKDRNPYIPVYVCHFFYLSCYFRGPSVRISSSPKKVCPIEFEFASQPIVSTVHMSQLFHALSAPAGEIRIIREGRYCVYRDTTIREASLKVPPFYIMQHFYSLPYRISHRRSSRRSPQQLCEPVTAMGGRKKSSSKYSLRNYHRARSEKTHSRSSSATRRICKHLE